MALNKAKVLTVTSVKGGVGKTTTLISLSGILSRLGKKTLIIDLDFYGSSVCAMMNIDYKTDIYNLFEDISNKNFDNISDYIYKYNDFIDVLPSVKDLRNAKKINSKIINTILYKAIVKYDVVLIDTNHMLNDINLLTFDNSDMILYVINNDSMNLKNMRSVVAILNDMQATNYKILLNNAVSKDRNYYNDYEIKNIIGKDIDYKVSYNMHIRNIDKYIIDGKVLTLDDKIYKLKDCKVYDKIINDFIKGER